MWQPSGAGASVAVCGLAGGLVVVDTASHVMARAARAFAICLIAALTGQAAGRAAAVLICWALAAIALAWGQKRGGGQSQRAIVAGAGLLGGIALTALHDIHGPPVLVGACAAVLMVRSRGREDGVLTVR